MLPITLLLLGSPQIISSEGTRDIGRDQSLWLICYVSLQDGWVSRESLKSLLWTDASESDASNNLRVLLHRAQRGLLAGVLEVESRRVRVTVLSDVKKFREALREQRWEDATELFRGDLLEGFQSKSVDFGAWLEQEREHLRASWQGACLNRASALEADCPETALGLLEEVYRRDDLCEEALQGVLRLSATLGQRERGVRHFEAFEGRLWRELGLRPQHQTLALLEVLRVAQSMPARSESALDVALRFRHALPAALTGFVGRQEELCLIAEQFGDAGVRLLTLTGPGGTGKTRLALEAASQIQARYEHGACYVACVGLTQVSQLPSAIGAALGLLGDADPHGYLRDRELLLILDNLEQLSDQNLDPIAELLEGAPRLRCLVTSREPLRLAGESVFDLWGLSYPRQAQFDAESEDSSLDLQSIADFDAVRLFTQAARHAQARFRLSAENALSVVGIAQLVGGMPLGLELAAAWTPVLTPAEIAAELARSLDAISSNNPSLPERHRSFRAVFEHSWNRLNMQEQSAFEQLGVFRGGFSRDAALNIAGASTGVLLSLVQKSLLRRNAAGRFELHELIRQFLEEKLFEVIPADRATNAAVMPGAASSATKV